MSKYDFIERQVLIYVKTISNDFIPKADIIAEDLSLNSYTVSNALNSLKLKGAL